ncbi:hypothetical protein BHQ17_11290 [Mycolicibacterium holsaticum]|uniref:DUF3152 domain-containing protein n=2 Tax=Mycolicibacterium holsaticum TaxID=152142 RepID=A0A1E3RX11_9MYCO|nr:hypothetical protein BHQ17_11290 [Mycolicibacterium holsaticum]
MTIREGCGYDIQLEASCYNPAYTDGQPRVFINEARWVRGAAAAVSGRVLRKASAWGKHLFHHYEGGRVVHVRARSAPPH